MEGDRLIHIALREFVSTSRVSEEATAQTVEIVHSLVHFLSISPKLPVRAVVWKRGAHQPGGPPSSCNDSSSSPQQSAGYGYLRKGVGNTGVSPQLAFVLPTAGRGDRLTPLAGAQLSAGEATSSPRRPQVKMSSKAQIHTHKHSLGERKRGGLD